MSDEKRVYSFDRYAPRPDPTENLPIPKDMTIDDIIFFMSRQDGHLHPKGPEYAPLLWDIFRATLEHIEESGDWVLHNKICGILRDHLDALPAWDDYDPAINLVYYFSRGTTGTMFKGRDF